VPTQNFNTIGRWSSRNDWVDRASAYDEEVQKMLAEEEERALKEGLASVGRRIIKLTEIAEQLEDELEDGMLWLERVKGIGSGQDGTFERVEELQFNAQLIKQLRGVYDDIAKELGQRATNVDVTSNGERLTGMDINIIDGPEPDVSDE
jgi:hypothetical protein